MVQAAYRGARGANAGDDFHELWASRQALALLDQDAGLTAVAVEGLRVEDESGTPWGTWDGVDCTLYYGGNQAASACYTRPAGDTHDSGSLLQCPSTTRISKT